jgi:hypothetical protein
LLYFITDATFGEKGAFMLQMTESILTALKSPPRKKPVVTANTTIYGITGRTYQYSQTLKALGCTWRATSKAWICPSQSLWVALKEGTIPNLPDGIRSLNFQTYETAEPEVVNAHKNPDMPGTSAHTNNTKPKRHTPMALQDIQ